MTPREEEILALIKKNPSISQNEMAEILNISRSSVATYISSLLEKGYIEGRGYILGKRKKIMVVGGANADILSVPFKKLIMRDSNPGHITTSPGGVGRNIAENLARLGSTVSFIGAIGSDPEAKIIEKSLSDVGCDTKDMLRLHDKNSSKYLAIHDENHDMIYAIADMDIMDSLNVEFLKTKSNIIKSFDLLVIDTNLREDAIEYLLSLGVETMVEAVSVNKAVKLRDHVKNISILKANKYEIKEISGIEVKDEKTLEKALRTLIEKGIKEIVLTLGEDGAIYYSEDKFIKAPALKADIVNVSGAGDAFCAGYAHAYLNNMEIEDRLLFASKCSKITLESEGAVSDKLNIESVR